MRMRRRKHCWPCASLITSCLNYWRCLRAGRVLVPECPWLSLSLTVSAPVAYTRACATDTCSTVWLSQFFPRSRSRSPAKWREKVSSTFRLSQCSRPKSSQLDLGKRNLGPHVSHCSIRSCTRASRETKSNAKRGVLGIMKPTKQNKNELKRRPEKTRLPPLTALMR